MLFPEQNSTNFPLSIKNNISEIIKNEYNPENYLKFHQFIVYKYLINNNKARGLLLFHEMGMGKSILAVALSEYYRLHDSNRKIVVLLSKSLQSNFKINIKKYIQQETNLPSSEIESIINNKYKFISLNASNMFTQVSRIDKTDEDLELEKQLKEFADVVSTEDFLENSVLIIDEFHNLSNSITNGSQNAIRLYDTIMKTNDIKLIFLTGTPIVNNPFELAPTFNMIRGYINIDSKQAKVPLFPELQKDFYANYIGTKNTIKNKDRFENRIFGLLSYYGSMYLGATQKEGFPRELPIKIVKVKMSSEQFSAYDAARDSEREEASVKKKRPESDRFKTKSGASSSYRVKSRQISNFLIPDYALTHMGKKVVKNIKKIKPYDLQNLAISSPKFQKIIDNIGKHKNQLGLVYSEFVSGEGIAIFAKVLDNIGYTCWQKKIQNQEDADSFDIQVGSIDPNIQAGSIDPNTSDKMIAKQTKSVDLTHTNKKDNSEPNSKTYAIITGDVDMTMREKIIKTFTNKNNITGQIISLLIISKTGAEGLDLKNVRHVHICEPYWNMARIEQIIARASRYVSHVDLPKSDQTVQPYIYLSDYPIDYDIKKKKEETTDIDLFTEAEKNKKLINQFYIAMANASIDCSLHEANFPKSVHEIIKCKLCAPTDKPLYNELLTRDLTTENPCRPPISSTVKVHGIVVDDVKYYYSKLGETYDIYKKDKSVNAYIPLKSHEYPYSEILIKLHE